MDTIPFFDLKRQYESLRDELVPAIEAVLDTLSREANSPTSSKKSSLIIAA